MRGVIIIADSIKSAREGFKRGTVEMIILSLLDENDEKYGYQLAQMIQEISNDILVIPEGSMYPTLYRLEEFGFIAGEKRLCGKRRQRTYYRMLPKGKERLAKLIHEYKLVQNGINLILEHTADEEA